MTSADSLFEHGRKQRALAQAPLPERMRPRNFDEFVGQEHILGPDRVLRRTIATGAQAKLAEGVAQLQALENLRKKLKR